MANILNLLPGQVRYTTMCREDGRIIDDVTVYKFGDEHFMVVTSSAPRKTSFRWIADHAAGMSAYVNDVSGAVALISVQGPRTRDLLSSLVEDTQSLLDLRFFRFAANRINDTELIISRSGYTGELGYELYVPGEEAASLWEFLERRGKEFGLLPYGVGAMQSLRIEKALPLAGPDIDGTQTPFELGLHKWIDFSKREFVGREALLEVQERGLRQRWVGLGAGQHGPRQSGRRRLHGGRCRSQPARHEHGYRRQRRIRRRTRRLDAGRAHHLKRSRAQRRQDAGDSPTWTFPIRGPAPA